MIVDDWNNKDNRIKFGNYEISKSHTHKGSSIFWDRHHSQSWIMFGCDGLTVFHKIQGGSFNIIGVDLV